MVERDGATMFNLLVTRANPWKNTLGTSVDWDDDGGEDGSLYPLSDPREPDGFRNNPDDGDRYLVSSNGFTLSESIGGKSLTTLSEARNTGVTLVVTESRVVMTCEKWRKFPSPFVLMGHIRYNWLIRVGYGRPLAIGYKKLRLVCEDGLGPNKGRQLALDLPVSRDFDGQELIDDIAERAAAYYLRLGRPIADDKMEQFQALASRNRSANTKAGQWLTHVMPLYRRVHYETAYTLDRTGDPLSPAEEPEVR